MNILKFVIFTLSFSAFSLLAKDCPPGVATLWKYDQTNESIVLLESKQRTKVCGQIGKQTVDNIKIELRMDEKTIAKSEIYWNSFIRHESLTKEKLEGKNIKKNDFKTLSFKIPKKEINNYLVTDIKSGRTLGKGKIE